MCIVQNTGNQKLLVHSGWKTFKKTSVFACLFVFHTIVFEFYFLQEKKREEKKIVLSSSPAEATIVRPSQKEEVEHFVFFSSNIFVKNNIPSQKEEIEHFLFFPNIFVKNEGRDVIDEYKSIN